jgi:4-carboxymuconolactone decarboxylase
VPRLKPITSKSDLPSQHQSVADEVVKVFGHIRGPFSMLLHSPGLASRVLPVVPWIREQCMVEPALRFVAILTAVREREAPYVWAAQVAQARRHVSAATIDLIHGRAELDRFSDAERDIVDYTRQLMRLNRVEQKTFDALNARYGAQWIVELTAAIAYIGFISNIANAFEVPAPPDGEKL